MPKLTIDNHVIEVEEGMTLLQAIQQLGIEVPVFCYHARLAVAGNCRMCLVDVEKAPKPVASCAMPATEGMVVHTDTPRVRHARQGVLEFLLINHPLDCPICDQGGECDLQDITMTYGGDRGRFKENKRAVPNKNFGPLIKTVMNRCIHCTRCIRFATEVAGVPDLGGLGRGEHMEVGTYVEKAVASELSGNMIDICPVGALTSKPYAFTGRPWELHKTESIDVLDALGSAIRVDSRGQQVMRILPRLHEEINEEWISDKSRFACDGLSQQRLDQPYVRRNGRLEPATWEEAFTAIATALSPLKPTELAAVVGDLVDAEAMVVLKDLWTALGSPTIDCRQDGAALTPGVRASYLFNSTIAGIDRIDACLLIGTNPRWEAPVLNARLRKRWLLRNSHLPVAVVGPQVDLTYPTQHLGNTPQVLMEILAGTHPFSASLSQGRGMVIVGQGALTHPDGAEILQVGQAIAHKHGLITEEWNGFNILHTAAARVAGLDLGLVPQPGKGPQNVQEILAACQQGQLKALYLLGADEIDMNALGSTFVIYQGHHGDSGAHRADVILPGAAYTEKSGTYVNTEGRVQQTQQSISPPGEAREDWKILRALSDYLKVSLPFKTREDVRHRLVELNRVFATLDQVQPASLPLGIKPGKISNAPFTLPIQNFYMTDPISRHSPTMAKCRATFSQKEATQ